MMRSILIAFLLLAVGCSGADLRPQSLQDGGGTPSAAADGQRLLGEVADAHGGRQAWLKAGRLRATMSDHWNPLYYTMASAWPKNGGQFQLSYLTGSDDGRIDFIDGDAFSWGIQNWRTYKVRPDGVRFADDSDIKFWIPTTAYFIEAPFRLVEAGIAYELAPKRVDGHEYRRVFFTWGTAEPQPNTDQYIAWIDSRTKQLRWLEYTVRDIAGFLTGCMYYHDMVNVNGFWLARTMTVVTEPGGEKGMHEYRVDEYEIPADFETAYVVPEPGQRGAKHP